MFNFPLVLKPSNIISLLLLLLVFTTTVVAQEDPLRRIQGAGSRYGRQGTTQGDSILHRTGLEDSITIRFRFLDSSRLMVFDSSITDFTSRFPIPWHHAHLGNLGNATYDLLFAPVWKPGWDHGFHAYDAYMLTVEDTRFFTTTRPYSEFGYLLGSKAEQMIHLLHTQNIRPNWNASFQYRLINSPGTFQNQNTNHNNYRFTSLYQSRNKRYHNYIIVLGNKIQSSENGGILSDGNYIDSAIYLDDRFIIPTNLNVGEVTVGRNFFNSNVGTGTKFTTGSFMLRQQYDLGQKDSIVTDSTVIPLFYPRLRLEHTIRYNTYNYRFEDRYGDSSYYHTNYNIKFNRPVDTFMLRDTWKEMINDFSIYQFPDAKNPSQYIKAGVALQNLKGTFDSGMVTKNFYNFFLHGEYRNRTRNRKWDIEAFGNFYVNGLNAGDYNAVVHLRRLISPKIGYLAVGFENVNRTPSFVFDEYSSFYLQDQPVDLNKENTIHLSGSLEQPFRRFRLTGSYLFISNYAYSRNYYEVDQVASIFNIVRIAAEKEFRLGRRWNWRTQLVLQQRAGDAPVNVPLLLTRNQIGYDGNLGFKNLLISMGLEFRYFTPFYVPGYSPITGQFYLQQQVKTQLRRPEVNAYVHFRIRSFTAYLRMENINTIDIANGGFTKNNTIIPGYPYPGLQIRLGIFWSFVN
jgi:hypothetical protein